MELVFKYNNPKTMPQTNAERVWTILKCSMANNKEENNKAVKTPYIFFKPSNTRPRIRISSIIGAKMQTCKKLVIGDFNKA